MVDRVFALAAETRLALLATGLTAAIVIVFRPLLYWLARDVNWRRAAAEIERGDERLGQRLQTVTSELLEPPRRGASREIVAALTREVGEVLATRRPQTLLRWRPTVMPWLAALLLGTMAVLLAQAPAVGLPQLAARFITPLRGIPRVTTTRLVLQPSTAAVVEGRALLVTVRTLRLGSDATVTLHHSAADARTWTSVPMTRRAEDTFEAVIPSVVQDQRYFARGGDGRTATGFARVLRKPVLAEMRVRYSYPSYTNRASLTVSNADGLIEAPVGSEAAVTFIGSEPLSSATVTLGDQTLATTPGEHPRERRLTLPVSKDQPYSLSLVSADGVRGGGPGTMMIRAIPDRPPLVRVVQPPGELRLSPRDIVSLPFQALDDYGVASLTTNVQVTASGVDASGEPINLAKGKPATQPSTWGGATADRAVDGNTDGNFLANSVTHTDRAPNGWWQVDLGNVTPVSVIEVWNRADAAPERLSDFLVFVSDAPFLSDDPAALQAQAGVATYRVEGAAGRPTTIELFRTARFVRVQLTRVEYLSLAEVRVLQAKPVAVGELASRTFDSHIAISADPRQQNGEATLDLARINVSVGDVVSVSVTATDTGKQVGIGGPIRVVVSPRSIDQRTYDRINELKRAAQLSASFVAQLDTAAKAFNPAVGRGVTGVDGYVAALAAATRELSSVTETSAVLQSALLRCIIRSDGPALAVALTAMIDELQQLSAASSALSATFAFDAAPSDADRAALVSTAAAAQRIRDDITAILRGEQAGAVLADLDNLRATEQGTPSAKEAADRARERARRVREDVAAATKELGLPSGGAEVEPQLRAMVASRSAAMATYRAVDFVPAAQAYAAAMAARQPLPGIVPRLSAAAQAEAVRADGNLIRARDLQLAASAALRVREANPEARGEFAASFATALAALQREHVIVGVSLPTTMPSVPPASTSAATNQVASTTAATTTSSATTMPMTDVHIAAAEARRKLSYWARGESERSATEAEALARAQELAMQANADLAQRQYESAEAADERILRELRLAERTFPSAAARYEQAREEVRRSTDQAKRIDRLTAEQQQLAARATSADRSSLQTAQDALAADMAEAAEDGGDDMDYGDASDTRFAAVSAIRSAQERLAAMPQQLRDVEMALGERAAATARLSQLQAQPMPAEDQAVADRAVRGAEQQLLEAEQRLAERLLPLRDVVAVDLVRSLSSFAPETSDAVRGLYDWLRPAMARLQRAASTGNRDAGSAVAELRGSIDGLQTQLKDAQASLLERDPLTAARAYAAAASTTLGSDPSAAVAHQQSASTALARAWDVTIHEAAAARLAGLPTMHPLFAPRPEAAAAPAQSAVRNVASKFPMFFDWGRLPWRSMQPLSTSVRPSDPPGYQDALQAYFEALGVVQPQAQSPEPK